MFIPIRWTMIRQHHDQVRNRLCDFFQAIRAESGKERFETDAIRLDHDTGATISANVLLLLPGLLSSGKFRHRSGDRLALLSYKFKAGFSTGLRSAA